MDWRIASSAAGLGLAGLLAAHPPAQGSKGEEQASASRELQQLFHDQWEFELRENPLFATYVGDRRYDDRLTSLTPEAIERRAGMEREFLRRIMAVDRSSLAPDELISADIFERLRREEIAEYEFNSHLIPITNREGFHISFAQLPTRVPLAGVEDYENYIARLRAFADYARQHIELMRTGMREGYILPAVVMQGYELTIAPHVVEDPTASLLYTPFEDFPESVPAAERERLRAAGMIAIRESVVPGYRAFLDFMTREYLPATRETIGASALPNGRDYYEHRVRRFTTLDIGPREVHELGLSEVRRVRAEMESTMREAGFAGSYREFVEMLRSDARFYAETPEELLQRNALIAKRMDGQLPNLFGNLPRLPYGIRPIPDYIAPRTTTAYYTPGSGDGTRAGYYNVNTYDLKSRPLFEIEALTFHESVPGHHLQIALQQELEDLPHFRRFAGFTVFTEGWALYAERLGLEVGFYDDPYSEFGRLSYEMWRACRLVVDPGIHYLGWTRRQAIDFMAENSALSLHNITAEVDRYISWPGQALAYKVGELKIRELRERAEAVLGERFDVREFHDVVLGSGAVPLDILERTVDSYLHNTSSSE